MASTRPGYQEGQELIAGPADLGLKVAGQVAGGRVARMPSRLRSRARRLRGEGRGGKGSDLLRQGKDPVQPDLETRRHRSSLASTA